MHALRNSGRDLNFFLRFCVSQIGFLKEVGLKLIEVSSRGVHGMYFHVFVVESNFQMTVESNDAIVTLSYWLKNFLPVFFFRDQ